MPMGTPRMSCRCARFRLATRMANLLVGLRLTLFGGKPIAPPNEITDLVDREVACATTRSPGGKPRSVALGRIRPWNFLLPFRLLVCILSMRRTKSGRPTSGCD
jgi:hypothetical protein